MNQLWKVGDLAKLTGLTLRTLRFYDQIGLFSPSAYSDSGHRLYNEADLSRLQQILSLKELGLSLEEIKSIVTGGHFSPLQIVSLQIARLKETIRVQQKLLAELESVSDLMLLKQPVTVEDFTKLLEMMKKSQEKMILKRWMDWEHRLDQLGDLLDKDADESNQGS
ncbi:MerR family transcriptional regulator [Paenibacillus alvei]|uniref:MerR family transcriptional regulator n=1 Tax=Paenibacillus alvei TaxID=44250 RepID=UPI0018CE57C9|nr:MerR family transcriptional regulator [Paenibacillus alvei]MBG9733931.1 MerR family transcriptional regulator [Paenibacillus alvei]MBG9745433.1 MerR family transcriptional regulator [Paenibacillus alvei]MCY7488037.1 MerR family transcriptional regulator [Paenibacillus alvei]MCY9582412.1 MerR family transcriptional regulator [Paenibacillus alvei]MCY9587216.1 MerR family transcriptional regulator [Paenibacillus alvei]